MSHFFHHCPKLTCVKPQMSSFGCGPYRRVAQQVRRTSSQDVCTQVCCCAWPHPLAPFSPPSPHPGGERVLGGLAGVIPLKAEALSGKPCADLGSPARNMPEIHVHHLMCYTDVCAVNTQQDILGSCYLTTGTYAKTTDTTTDEMTICSKAYISVQLLRKFSDAFLQFGRTFLFFFKIVNI